MPAQPQPDTKKPRRWRRRLILLFLLLCTGLTGIYLLRNAFFGDMLKRGISDTLAGLTGCEVTIGEISGSWLFDLRIDDIDLHTRNPDSSSLQELHIDSISTRYSLSLLLSAFSIENLHALRIDNLNLKLKSLVTNDSKPIDLDQITIKPSAIAAITQAQLPELYISGHVDWQQEQHYSGSDFELAGSDKQLTLELSDTIIKDHAQEIGAITLERQDRNTFFLMAPDLHKQIHLHRARCTITRHAIDAKLPLHIAEQKQTIIWHYSRQHQSLDLNLDFHWKQTPAIIRSLAPQLLPHHGHSRMVASIHNAADEFDLTCMLQANNLQWTVNDKLIEASIHAFIKNNDKECSIEINNIDIQAPAHHVAINNTVMITSNDHQHWNIADTSIKTRSGSIDIGGVVSQSESNLHVSWEAFDLGLLCKAFEINNIRGLCDGAIHMTGSLLQPDLDVKLSSAAMTINEQPLQIDLDCAQRANGITIDHCSIVAERYLDALIIGSWPRRIGSTGWQTVIDGEPDISVHVDAHRLDLWPKLHQYFNGGSAQLSLELSSLNGQSVIQGKLDLSDINLDLIEDHDDFTLNSSNLFYITDTSCLWQFQVTQRYDQYIKGRISMDVPGPLLEINTWQPDWQALSDSITGQLDAHDLHFKIKGSVPRIGDIRGSIEMNGRRISTETLHATLGYEPMEIHGFIQTGFPHVEATDLRLKGKRILLVQSPGLRLRTDCDLHIYKDSTQPLTLSGSAVVVDALYTSEFITTERHTPEVDSQFQLFSLPESFLGGAQLDLRVSAERTIRIRNSMLRADASGEMRIRGTGMVPEPGGEVLIHENSRLNLPFSHIWFSPSTITFNPAEPFDPRFIINGRTKMQGYDLRIILEGKMSEFSVNGIDVVSNPPISREEATRLITTGVPPRNINSTGKDIDTSGLVIGWAIVETMRKVFGNGDPEREDYFNQIEVQIGREVSRNGYNTIEVTAPVPYTDSLYLKAERDKYEDFNAEIIWRTEW